MKLDDESESILELVNPKLAKVVRSAAGLCSVQIKVIEGLRSPERQLKLFEEKHTKELDSPHLHGRAVDLGVLKDGAHLTWDWENFYLAANSMRAAAIVHSVSIRWGGVWDMKLEELIDARTAVANYVLRRKKLKLSAFLDGGHFELAK